MKYSELYSELDSLFPLSLQTADDNDGDMLCIDNDREIKRVLISLDASMPAIDYAILGNFDLILTHHPLIYVPLSRMRDIDAVGARVVKLIKNGIRVMSFHTRLDCVAVNDCLAALLEMENIRSFEYGGVPMGRIGDLPRIMPADTLASYIKKKLGCDSVVYTPCNDNIKSLALLGGGGCSSSKSARAAGADALLTGDYTYHYLLDYGEIAFPVFAAGHFFTENPVCSYLEKTLHQLHNDVYTEIFNCNTLKTC